MTAFGSASYGYDADGCTINRSAQTIRYDPERCPVRVDENGVTLWRATYDGDGSRRKRLDAKGTIHYVGPYERSVGNGQDVTEVVTKYYSASMGGMSRLIAMRKNGVLAWVGTDHLGGTILVADYSFSPLDQMRYTPYGVDRDPGTHLNTDHKFTSQIEDGSIGLYWYASRAYDPMLGRFTAPDTVVPGAGNPQALNRYSYVLNNPLKFMDPSGHAMHFFHPEGEDVLVVSEAEGFFKGLAETFGGPGMTVTASAHLIVSPVDIDSKGYEDLLSHEMGHVMQARALGPAYLPTYAALLGQGMTSMQELGYDLKDSKDMAYASHPMEIGANLNVGLPMFWHVDHQVPQNSTVRHWELQEVPYLSEWWDELSKYLNTPIPQPYAIPAGSSGDAGANGAATTLELTIPAEVAPGGVGVVGITRTNGSGSPANGGDWVSPGGANAEADAAARRAAWERAGCPDYNNPGRDDFGNITGYHPV